MMCKTSNDRKSSMRGSKRQTSFQSLVDEEAKTGLRQILMILFVPPAAVVVVLGSGEGEGENEERKRCISDLKQCWRWNNKSRPGREER
jgi:hypothetical protein